MLLFKCNLCRYVPAYAAMASELNRTLVLWPVFTSPHYENNGNGPALRFSDYVQITGAAVDSPDRVVAFADAPQEVRDFPRRHPEACQTSNDRPNPVQFPVSADLKEAVVAPPGKRATYAEQVLSLRAPDEVMCVASTVGLCTLTQVDP
jgi:hypothetical protein